MNEPSPSSRALPVLLALGCTWGASFLFIKVIVGDTGPTETTFGRLFFGSAAVAAFILVSRRRVSFTRRMVGQTTLLALLANVVPFILIAWGQDRIESGTGAILNATVPIFTAVFAAAILDEEHFTRARAFGLLLCIAGVGVLTGEGVLNITDSSVLGQLAIVGAAMCYGMGAVFSRQLLRDQDPVNLSMLQLGLATLIALPLTFAVNAGSPDFTLDPEAWAAVIALGIGGTGLGYIAFLWLISNIGSVRASLVTYIVPVIAVILGWLVLDETIGLNTIAGGALIIAGVASVMRGNIPARAQTPPPNEGEAIPALSGGD